MCQNCATATQHFTDGTAPGERPLQTSVENGTSPDWKSSPGAQRGSQLLDQFDDPDYIGHI